MMNGHPMLTTLPSGRMVLDTGKVQIGLRAERRREDIGTQAEHMQAVLLATRHSEREHLEAEARRAGVRVDLRGFSDDEVEQLTWVAEHEEDPVIFTSNDMALLVIAIIFAVVAALIVEPPL